MTSLSGLGVRAAVAGAMVLAAAHAASAHHSFAMFDATKEVTVDGVVRDFQWTNPHTWIQLTVSHNGVQEDYSIEGSSPNGLQRHGWTRNTLKAGDSVKIVIHPLRDGRNGGSFVRAILPDGKVLLNG